MKKFIECQAAMLKNIFSSTLKRDYQAPPPDYFWSGLEAVDNFWQFF